MPGYKKVAVSMPSETFRELERARAKLKQSRSEVIATAVTDWLRRLDTTEQDRRYIEGYLRIPDVVTAEDEAWVAESVKGWDTWDWEAGKPSLAGERKAPTLAKRKPRSSPRSARSRKR